jgi:branched-subunit amino acid transport protein
MDHTAVLVTILAMAAVTYLPRLLPIWFLSSRSLPKPIAAWLRYVPIAVLSAMVVPSLLLVDGHVHPLRGNLYFWAAIPTAIVAWRTQSLLGAVVVGIATVALGRLAGP